MKGGVEGRRRGKRNGFGVTCNPNCPDEHLLLLEHSTLSRTWPSLLLLPHPLLSIRSLSQSSA